MNKTTKLEDLTVHQIEMLREACSSFFPVEILGEGYQGSEVKEFSIPELGLSWKSREAFLIDILGITGQKEIIGANKILEKTALDRIKEVEAPKGQDQTLPSNMEDLEKTRAQSEEQHQKTRTQAKEDLEEVVKKLEELKARKDQELKDLEARGEKDKKYYAKVETKEEVKLSKEEQEVFDKFKEFAKANPAEAKAVLQEIFEERVGGDLKKQGFTDEEIKNVLNETATQITENLYNYDNPSYVPQTHQTAILTEALHKSEIFGKGVSESANNLAVQHLLQYQMYKDITTATFGKDIADSFFGVDADKLQVSVSETPQAGYTQTFTPYTFVQSDRQIVADQSETLALVKDFGIDKGKQVLLGQAGKLIEKRMALLAPQSTAAKLLGSTEIKSLLFTRFGIGTPIQWTATNMVGKLALKIAPEYVPMISGVGKLTGINVGLVGKAVPTGIKIAEQAGGQATGKIAGQVAAKTGFAGLVAKIAAFLGIGTGWATFGLSAIAGIIVGEIIKKIDWGKVKKFFSEVVGPLLLVGGGVMFGAPALGLAAGGFAFGAARGLTMAAVGAGIFRFFKILGGAFVTTIATPIIVTLLVLPPLVAFIMLVINNSAYMVPPDMKSLGINIDNPYMLVVKKAEPDEFPNPTTGKTTVTYTVTITALKTTLTNLKILETPCTVSKKNASTIQDCPPELENIPPLPDGLSISPASPYSFTFTSDFDSTYSDSSVFDSIKVQGDTEEKKGIITSGSESVCIGDCPHGCFVISDNNEKWPSNFGSTLDQATKELISRFPYFVDKVCSGGKDLNLCYTTKDPSPMGTGGLCNNAIYARHIHTDTCDINFNQCSLDGSGADAIFLLTHELTHHVQKIDGNIINKYRNSGAPSELPLCSYDATANDDYEGSAEANALYVATASWAQCVSNFKNQYPKNYSFANDYMNNP